MVYMVWERERQVGQVLAYLTSMDMNLCFSASMSTDLHELWRRYKLSMKETNHLNDDVYSLETWRALPSLALILLDKSSDT